MLGNLKNYLCMIFIVLVCGCDHEEDMKKYYEGQIITAEVLRGEYVKTLISRLHATQVLGGADSGFNGNGDLLKQSMHLSESVIPNGEYRYHFGANRYNPDGYKFHIEMDVFGISSSVFKKED